MKDYAAISQSYRELAVHPVREEGYVTILVGEMDGTKKLYVKAKAARKFAKALLKNADVAEKNHVAYQKSKEEKAANEES